MATNRSALDLRVIRIDGLPMDNNLQRPGAVSVADPGCTGHVHCTASEDRPMNQNPPRSALRSAGRAFLKLLGAVAACYALLVALIAASQTALLFPRWAVAPAPALPQTAELLRIAPGEGVVLYGHRLPGNGDEAPLLAFGGNAWNAAALALYLHGILPERDIIAFHFRGYAPSTGHPSAAALSADAKVIHDWLVARGHPAPLVAGFSIGSGPAADLAANRPVAGVLLVTAFDSLEALARAHHPWAPVRLLLRHRMEPAQALSSVGTPIAMISASRDRIVFPQRTEALRRALDTADPGLVFDRTIAADHNDLYGHPDMAATLRAAVAALQNANAAGQ